MALRSITGRQDDPLGQLTPWGQMPASERSYCLHVGLAMYKLGLQEGGGAEQKFSQFVRCPLSKEKNFLPTLQYPTSYYEFLSIQTKMSREQNTSSFNYTLENISHNIEI